MPSAISLLYEPMIDRELDAIPEAVTEFRKSHTREELFQAVARFGALAFAPTEHCRHALLSCISLHQVQNDVAADHYDEWLSRCAAYFSQSRLPWSEPPLTELPSTTAEDAPLDALRGAMDRGDRHGAERWLARNLSELTLARDFFAAAIDDLSGFGTNLVTALSAWTLSALLSERERYATLRLAVWEWTSAKEKELQRSFAPLQPKDLARALAETVVAERGALAPFHELLLFDAARTAAALAPDLGILEAVSRQLPAQISPPGTDTEASESAAVADRPPSLQPYSLARDYGEALIAQAVAQRLEGEIGLTLANAVRQAALTNLTYGPSFEEWSLA